jgi:hypothetical protein
LEGFGEVVADCTADMETDVLVDVEAPVTGGSISATSVVGQTMCGLLVGTDYKFSLECDGKTEDSAGIEVEEKVEVEVGLEEEDDDA